MVGRTTVPYSPKDQQGDETTKRTCGLRLPQVKIPKSNGFGLATIACCCPKSTGPDRSLALPPVSSCPATALATVRTVAHMVMEEEHFRGIPLWVSSKRSRASRNLFRHYSTAKTSRPPCVGGCGCVRPTTTRPVGEPIGGHYRRMASTGC